MCHDLNDEFMINEETIHALDELTEKYRKKVQHIGQENSNYSKRKITFLHKKSTIKYLNYFQ